MLAGIQGRTLQIWDLASSRSIRLNDHRREMTGVAWSSDGKSLATTSDHGSVRIWDALWNQTAYAAAISGRTTFGVTETLELVEGRFGGLPWLRAAIPMPVEGCGEPKRP